MYSWSTRAHPIGEYIGSLEVTDTSQGLALSWSSVMGRKLRCRSITDRAGGPVMLC